MKAQRRVETVEEFELRVAANANESTMDSGSLKNGQSQLCFQSLSQCR
jgi:hypothetical protein